MWCVCMCVLVCECVRSDQYWKPESAFLGCDVFAWSLRAKLWPALNTSSLQCTAPQTPGRRRVQVSGCWLTTPWALWWLLWRDSWEICVLYPHEVSEFMKMVTRERAHCVLYISTQSPSELCFMCCHIFSFFSRCTNFIWNGRKYINNRLKGTLTLIYAHTCSE